jgi:hypothetical protein
MKNIKITLTPAEAYIVSKVLMHGYGEVVAQMQQDEAAGRRSIITANYIRQIIEPIIKELEQQ